MTGSPTPRYQSLRALLPALALLAGCGAPAPLRAPAEAAPPGLPATVLASPAYTVQPDRSTVHILVRRAGLLARLGHNHVVVAPVHGVIHVGETTGASGFDLVLRPLEFTVDADAARRAAGAEFAGGIADDDRAATRRNMLGPDVLAAGAWPDIRLLSSRLHGPLQAPEVEAHLTLRGVTYRLRFPATVVDEGNGQIRVTAQFVVRQRDVGIEPFSVLGGGLSVADELELSAEVVARRR